MKEHDPDLLTYMMLVKLCGEIGSRNEEQIQIKKPKVGQGEIMHKSDMH